MRALPPFCRRARRQALGRVGTSWDDERGPHRLSSCRAAVGREGGRMSLGWERAEGGGGHTPWMRCDATPRPPRPPRRLSIALLSFAGRLRAWEPARSRCFLPCPGPGRTPESATDPHTFPRQPPRQQLAACLASGVWRVWSRVGRRLEGVRTADRQEECVLGRPSSYALYSMYCTEHSRATQREAGRGVHCRRPQTGAQPGCLPPYRDPDSSTATAHGQRQAGGQHTAHSAHTAHGSSPTRA